MKWCSECVKEVQPITKYSKEKNGTVYVFICPLCGIPLTSSVTNTKEIINFDWRENNLKNLLDNKD